MMDWKRIGRKLLFPGRIVLLVGVPLAAATLAYAFAAEGGEEIVSYGAFAYSAYMTVAVCVRMPRLVREASARMHRSPWLHRCLTDAAFRMHVSLYLSLGINILYAVMKLLMGAYDHSVWFGTLGVYYALLTALRFMLLGHVRRGSPSASRAHRASRCTVPRAQRMTEGAQLNREPGVGTAHRAQRMTEGAQLNRAPGVGTAHRVGCGHCPPGRSPGGSGG